MPSARGAERTDTTGATVTDAAASDRLSAQTTRDAVEKIKSAEYTVCVGSNQHVVHPVEYERGGLTRCGACFQVVYIPTPDERGEDR